MKTVVLVSHGNFAEGLADALSMLAGKRSDLISCTLKDGSSADDFAKEFEKKIENLKEEDEILLLGDLIGGSPMTTACNVIAEKGLAPKTRVLGGMNLPLALCALLMKDSMDLDTLKESILGEGKEAMKEFVLSTDEDEEEEV